jgi:tetratricopeptide (TPR) repeat protein
MKRWILCGLCAIVLAGCGDSADDLRKRGVSEFQIGHLTIAKESFQKVLSRSPGDPESNYYMGRIAHAEGNLVKASMFYQSCLGADPRHQEARQWLERAENEGGQPIRNLRFIPQK